MKRACVECAAGDVAVVGEVGTGRVAVFVALVVGPVVYDLVVYAMAGVPLCDAKSSKMVYLVFLSPQTLYRYGLYGFTMPLLPS